MQIKIKKHKKSVCLASGLFMLALIKGKFVFLI